ncbi:MAG TPA: glycosyltransferase [Gemmatirosa sp.]
MPIRILTLLDDDANGGDAAGRSRALDNVAQQLGGDLDVHVVERGNQDTRQVLRDAIATTPHDVLYLFGLAPRRITAVLALQRLGLVPPAPVVVAPDGTIRAGGGAQSALRRGYLRAIRRSGVLRDVLWHASGARECDDLVQVLGTTARVRIAPPLVGNTAAVDAARNERRRDKRVGELRIGVVARIDRESNVLAAIAMAGALRGRVTLDVYGAVADAGYWRACEQAIVALPADVVVRAHGPLPAAIAARVWASHHVCLVPSDGERATHVLHDALSAGCPVIVGDRAPWRDLEAQGIGWDLPISAPARFRAALQRCADMTQDELGEWGMRAAAYARARRDDAAVPDATVALFREAVADARIGAATTPAAARPALAA